MNHPITRMAHVTLFVKDQDEALSFYTEKLGFEVRTDVTLEGFRWLTVGAINQPDMEIALLKPYTGPMMDQETVDHFNALLDKGALGAGVFHSEAETRRLAAETTRGKFENHGGFQSQKQHSSENSVACGRVVYTDDCQATYEELNAKGVEFIQPPSQRPYGIEALFRDNSGNWFSLTQPS